MINLFNWVTTLVESFTFYGGGGKGGGGGNSAGGQAQDFFGVGARAPYAALLGELFGVSGSTAGSTTTTNSSGGGSGGGAVYYDPKVGQYYTMSGGGGVNPAFAGGETGINGASGKKNYIGTSPTGSSTSSGGMSIYDFIQAQPGYQFGLNQGQQSLSRQQAAMGLTGSGNQAVAMQQYGQGYAGQALQTMISNLMPLSAAGQAPMNLGQPNSTGLQTAAGLAGMGISGASQMGLFSGGASVGAPAIGSTAFWMGTPVAASGGAAAGGAGLFDALFL